MSTTQPEVFAIVQRCEALFDRTVDRFLADLESAGQTR